MLAEPCYAEGLSTDTKWIIGTGVAIITAIVGTGAVLAGLLLTQIAGVNARIDNVNARIDDVNTRIGDVNTRMGDMNARMGDMNTRMDRIELRLDGFDERLRSVEVAFGKVDQRLLTIERVLLPAAASGE